MTSPASTPRTSPRLLLILFSAMLLCACGQTGALYLPEEASEQKAESKRHTGDNH